MHVTVSFSFIGKTPLHKDRLGLDASGITLVTIPLISAYRGANNLGTV